MPARTRAPAARSAAPTAPVQHVPVTPAAPVPAPSTRKPPDLSDLGGLVQLWQQALEPDSPRKLRSILAGLKPTAFERGQLVAQLVGPVGNLVETNRGAIEDLLSKVAGQPVRLQLDQTARGSSDGPTTHAHADGDEEREPAAPVVTPEEVANDPLVAKAVELFGARDIRVVPKKRPGG